MSMEAMVLYDIIHDVCRKEQNQLPETSKIVDNENYKPPLRRTANKENNYPRSSRKLILLLSTDIMGNIFRIFLFSRDFSYFSNFRLILFPIYRDW